jgi:hypothetical protein
VLWSICHGAAVPHISTAVQLGLYKSHTQIYGSFNLLPTFGQTTLPVVYCPNRPISPLLRSHKFSRDPSTDASAPSAPQRLLIVVCANQIQIPSSPSSSSICPLSNQPTISHFPVPVLPTLSPPSSGITMTSRLSSRKRSRHALIPPSRMKTLHFKSGASASSNHPAQRVALPSDEEQWKTTIGMFARRVVSVGRSGWNVCAGKLIAPGITAWAKMA